MKEFRDVGSTYALKQLFRAWDSAATQQGGIKAVAWYHAQSLRVAKWIVEIEQ